MPVLEPLPPRNAMMNSKSFPSRSSSPHNRPRQGRSAPRSRNGCLMCKQRRVRCDEIRPVCGHCTRLELECLYRKRPILSQRSSAFGSSAPRSEQHSISGDATQETIATQGQSLVGDIDFGIGKDRGRDEPLNASRESAQAFTANESLRTSFAASPQLSGTLSTNCVLNSDNQRVSRSYIRDPCESFYGWSTHITADDNCSFPLDRTFDPPNGQDSLGTFTFPYIQRATTNWSQGFNTNASLQGPRNHDVFVPAAGQNAWPLSIDNLLGANLRRARLTSSIANNRIDADDIDFSPGSDYMNSQRGHFLLNYFREITQPPALILTIGVRKWRRL